MINVEQIRQGILASGIEGIYHEFSGNYQYKFTYDDGSLLLDIYSDERAWTYDLTQDCTEFPGIENLGEPHYQLN